MPPEKPKPEIAIIGAGGIGRRHLQVFGEAENCDVVAIADPTAEARELARSVGVSWFENPDELFAEKRPDGVINATPNRLHKPVTLTCLEKGVPVLVEKPVADTLEDALAIAEASDKYDAPVLVGHHRRHNPLLQEARRIIRSGELGQIQTITAQWLALKPEPYFDVEWRRQKGAGPVLLNLIHDMDSLRYIAGEIESIQAMTSSKFRGFEVEDTAAILMHMKSGALATITLSDAAASPWSWELTSGEITSRTYPETGEDSYRFAGSEGSLGIPTMRLWRHDGEEGWESPMSLETHEIPAIDPFARQAAHFLDVIRGGVEPLVTARDAARTLEATLAVAKAAETGTAVRLSD